MLCFAGRRWVMELTSNSERVPFTDMHLYALTPGVSNIPQTILGTKATYEIVINLT
jgi:hypothetical protein